MKAIWHDLQQAEYDGDLPLYRELAMGARTVLELGAGTGNRIAHDLDVPVDGVDLDRELLEAGRTNFRHIYEQDVAELDIPTVYDLILAPVSFVQISQINLAVFFARVRRHLAPGGVVAIDLQEVRPIDGPCQARKFFYRGLWYCMGIAGSAMISDDVERVMWNRWFRRPGRYARHYIEPVYVDYLRVLPEHVIMKGKEFGLRHERTVTIKTEGYIDSWVILLRG